MKRTVPGDFTVYMSCLERESGTLRGDCGECGVFAQTEDRRWVHRNGCWERVSVCGVKDNPGGTINAALGCSQIESIVEFVLKKCYNGIDFTE